MFYSIQGEGSHTGRPSVFLRLQGCNLTCGGRNTIKTKQLDPHAAWRCDTIEVWTKGQNQSFESILSQWQHQKWINYLKNGAHLVLTGGEPLMWQDQFILFIQYFQEKLGFKPYIECETNATLLPGNKFCNLIDQYNVSPKLANSGMSKTKRVKQNVLHFFSNQSKAHFKFVVATKADCDEIEQDFIYPFSIPLARIQLMPAADSRESCLSLSEQVVEWAKDIGVGFSTRLHLLLWNKKTGV